MGYSENNKNSKISKKIDQSPQKFASIAYDDVTKFINATLNLLLVDSYKESRQILLKKNLQQRLDYLHILVRDFCNRIEFEKQI